MTNIPATEPCEAVALPIEALVGKYVTLYNKTKASIKAYGKSDPEYQKFFNKTFGTIKPLNEWDKTDLVKLYDQDRTSFNNLINVGVYAVSRPRAENSSAKNEEIKERQVCAVASLNEIAPLSCKNKDPMDTREDWQRYVDMMKEVIAEIKARPKTSSVEPAAPKAKPVKVAKIKKNSHALAEIAELPSLAEQGVTLTAANENTSPRFTEEALKAVASIKKSVALAA